MKMFIFISIVYLIVPVFGQYTYELEDINPNSSTNGNIIGTNYFADKTMLHYFGSFTWLICASRFGELNVIYNSFKEQGYPIELIGVGKSNESSGLENWTEGNNAPICADNPPYPVWNDWNATQRDLYITDANGNLVFHENITSGIPDNFLDQLQVLLDVARDNYPINFHIYQNYPNPFNPNTLIRYDLEQESFVNIAIHNMLGQKVKTLVNNLQSAGSKSISWDATNKKSESMPAGLYFYKIKIDQQIKIKKMTLLK